LKTDSKSRNNTAIITLDDPAPGAAIDHANEIDANYNTNADILASLQNGQRAGVMTASSDSRIYLKNDKITGSLRKDGYRSSNVGGAGHADQVIHGEEFADAPSLVVALNGRAHSVDFIDGRPYLQTSKVVTSGGATNNPMLVVLDGMIMGTQSGIDDILPRMVETVEILKGSNAAIYGVQGGAGVMVITTREQLANNKFEGKGISAGVYSFTPVGFYKAREFYAPRYDAADANKLTDTRTTIFWKPDVITGADGNASFNFFNAEGVGNYRVVIEGMDSKGNLGRQVYKYRVE